MHRPNTRAARPGNIPPVEAAAGLGAFADAIDDDTIAKALLKFALCIMVSLVTALWYRN
jgi:hypothetical protein